MRLPNSAHTTQPWHIHAVVPDFTLKDVWALPAHGGPEDFEVLLERTLRADPATEASLAVRFLWRTRDRLGTLLDLGEISSPVDGAESEGKLEIPGTDEISLADRLPDDLRGTAADLRFDSLPFVPLYRTNDEFAAEVSNRTVHGVLHLGWVERDRGRYQGRLAVYVKERGHLGKAYMAAIAPFRYWIVYPALMRQIEREWAGRAAARS